ncbi:MAG: F0F1 ATP synthase subunit epsilon [Henriciella sp.]|jgi:F-type H+-transporting ATPase subunit epsilon|uniref:F0F1 ATP synthase subunit epsilon n=1 Tax=Henriciella sp. TaxID=1968823 RepID=UPI000C10DF2C|nr:F0F1 ATP synthase subunit epsilon [Henriciella sp.]MAN75006.1 F0F1 ATP synthase subunit epsilon [Henriciella sp.]MBF33797.1 F0F1 ATP synthase subunit epsilon [Hyphomonadaceae bacterium]MBK74443.1 F0F1 ATP synthase subunit epsilon [Henriciella sp.]PHR76036.1 MAG: F0F1 ATP synthase subunit epsilon [Henriciella sp.]|tara:strand:- start:649 stop:1056 length:408 start_codon:yes stop_codon:yes gene_type:complete
MAAKLHFSLVSPAKELFSGEVDHVIAPGTEGEFGVLANHAPFMTTLKNGIVRVLENDQTKMRLFVRGGFADVTPAGLTILAEEAVDLASVDSAQVNAELEEVRNKLSAEGKDGPHEATLKAQIDYLSDLRAALAH